MTGDKVTIVKYYKVFQGDQTVGEPMDEPTEQHLYGWLRTRGFSEPQARHIIEQADDAESVIITLP